MSQISNDTFWEGLYLSHPFKLFEEEGVEKLHDSLQSSTWFSTSTVNRDEKYSCQWSYPKGAINLGTYCNDFDTSSGICSLDQPYLNGNDGADISEICEREDDTTTCSYFIQPHDKNSLPVRVAISSASQIYPDDHRNYDAQNVVEALNRKTWMQIIPKPSNQLASSSDIATFRKLCEEGKQGSYSSHFRIVSYPYQKGLYRLGSYVGLDCTQAQGSNSNLCTSATWLGRTQDSLTSTCTTEKGITTCKAIFQKPNIPNPIAIASKVQGGKLVLVSEAKHKGFLEGLMKRIAGFNPITADPVSCEYKNLGEKAVVTCLTDSEKQTLESVSEGKSAHEILREFTFKKEADSSFSSLNHLILLGASGAMGYKGYQLIQDYFSSSAEIAGTKKWTHLYGGSALILGATISGLYSTISLTSDWF